VRAQALIDQLALSPHPEGGWYRRLYRSATDVVGPVGPRAALTTIVYLLRAGETGRWHRVSADEAWHFYDGAPLDLWVADARLESIEARRLGPVDLALPVSVVPANCWQAARSQGDYSLVGCTVAPGFEFTDFTLLADDAALSDRLRRSHPAHAGLL
jgi:predicted cupin superfamily sugar epimerase